MESVPSQQPHQEKSLPSREERFVIGILKACTESKGLAARLRRADNPATEYQSWELLASHGINLELEHKRLPFVTVAAAIAKAKIEHNGGLKLGHAIAACYDNGNTSDQAKARLRRLLACDDLDELCRILRPLLSLIDSKVSQPLDYVRLLKQLQRFSFNTQQVRAQWAQEFYGQATDAEQEDA